VTTPYLSNRPPPKRRLRHNRLLIREIGHVVRTERAKRGMTRRMLAQQAGVSERYLAQIELGRGNPSVLTLDEIARAMVLDLFDLLPALTPQAARQRATIHLRQLPPDEVRAFLHAFDAYGIPRPGARQRRIALVGLRGAGKSTLGAALAHQLHAPFVELDQEIERDHGAPAATLFEVYGHATFRRYERETLSRVINAHATAVIATAGGIVADEGTFAELLERTHVVWLKATPADHMRRVMGQGDFRPMARNPAAMEDLIAILDARTPAYARAHASLDTSGKSVEACVDELVQIAGKFFAGAKT
jgi:XRE family transcriptional regulator, aerobic/anaerobic benzoate catabolism transcriptional regulator